MASRATRRKRMFQEQQAKQGLRQIDKAVKMPVKPLTIIDIQAAYKKGFEEGFEKGRQEGFMQSSHHTVRSAYAAILIAAHKLFGFGQERGIRLLNEVNRTLLETLTTPELADRAFDEIGVEIDWTEPVEQAQPKDPIRKTKGECV